MLIYSITNEIELENIPKWAEWIELRVDLSPTLLNHLSALTCYQVIITERWNREGGKSSKSLSEKLDFFNSLSTQKNLYFDLEIDLLDDNIEKHIDFQKYILSYHSFQSLELSVMKDKLSKALSLNPFIVKIAQTCSSLLEVKELYQVIREFGGKVLWVVMGEYGKLQRLLHPYLKSLGTFVAYDGRETVAGQINLSDVEKYQHLLSSKLFKWGGIIGGKQVFNSLGIDFYNNYFKENDMEACYLPINLKEVDLSDFFDLIENNEFLQETCYGFSLTMPFKQSIPSLFNHFQISNLLIYGKAISFYNTDFDALEKIKQAFNELSIKKVLVYGTGSMAEMALGVFSDYEIFLTGRNKNKLVEFQNRRKNIEIIDQISPEIYFDLLINTSPIGMKGESFSQETGISKFKYVIDLPYSISEIPLQKEVEKGKYISGRVFWVYQSERQLQLFKERIEND